MGGEKMKKLEWSKPVLVELGSARVVSFGQNPEYCDIGSGFFQDGE